MTVISFQEAVTKRDEEHKEREMTIKCRNLNALISELSLVVNKHVNCFGASTWQAAGSALYILAKALAEADPTLEKPEIRGYVHDLLDKYTDQALVDLWEAKGEAP